MTEQQLAEIESQKEAVDELLKNEEYLTDWELNFCRSISTRLKNYQFLSEKQAEVLRNLTNKVKERFD